MVNQICGTIRLSGEDSIRFINSLLRPSRQDIERNSNILNNIDKNVNIIENATGFEAIVNDLDLSFLNDFYESHLTIETTYTVAAINGHEMMFENNMGTQRSGEEKTDREFVVMRNIQENHEYRNGLNYLYMAA